MIKKPNLFITVFCVLSIIYLAVPAKAYFMVIDIIQKKAGSVYFPHHHHLAANAEGGAAIECARCHHELTKPGKKDQRPSLCTTTECHPLTKKEALAVGRPEIKKAFHNLCKKCHRDQRRQYPDAPTKCAGCHNKELSTFTNIKREKEASQ